MSIKNNNKMKLIILLSFVGLVFVEGINYGKGNFITGGSNAHAAQFPFVVSVHHADEFICGGALVGSKWVLTSALCIWGYQSEVPSRYYIRAGSTLTTHTPGAQYIQAAKVYPHPDFHARKTYTSERKVPSLEDTIGGKLRSGDQWVYYGNIALIELVQEIIPSTTVEPTMMAFATEVVAPGSIMLMAGWGGKDEGTPSTTLEYTNNLPIIDMIQCKLLVPGMEEPEFDIEQICAAPFPDATACEYDHGGPLFRFDPIYGTVLLGIINYAPCNDPQHPTIFSSVPNHRYWIYTIIGS